MSPYSPGSHRAIVLVDMADFTNPARTSLHRTEMIDGLEAALRDAFDNAGIDWKACDVENRGDGFLILAPSDCPSGVLAGRMVRELLGGLLRYNGVHTAEATIQLRMALHAGEVRDDRGVKDGDALNFCFRILEADRAKTALRQHRGVLALIVSESFYDEVVRPDPAIEPALFRRIPVHVKHTDGFAWLRITGTVELMIEDSLPLAVFGEAELAKLRGLLVDVSVPGLPVLAARATGFGEPPPRTGTACEIVEHLLDQNAGPDGMPPVLAFLELVAGQVGGALATELRAWTDSQARHSVVRDALRAFRSTTANPPAAAPDPLRLSIMIDHDGADPDHLCLVSYWRQDDPQQWPPARGDTVLVPVAEIERQVDRVVIAAETAWSDRRGEVALEFVLPRTLLGVPVEMWRKELDSGDPQPLGLEYPISVRSLERMRAQHWHRLWRNRWGVLTENPDKAYVHYATGAQAGDADPMTMRLKDPHVVGVTLTTAPHAQEPKDELTAALRAGLPIVFWTRPDVDAPLTVDALRTLVTHLAEKNGLIDLPRRALNVRQSAVTGDLNSGIAAEAVRRLVLLYDDPERLLILDQPPTPRRPRGDAEDERERAS